MPTTLDLTELTAFLSAVGADAEDELSRLVFADWLQDHDDHERAELVRIASARQVLETFRPPREQKWSDCPFYSLDSTGPRVAVFTGPIVVYPVPQTVYRIWGPLSLLDVREVSTRSSHESYFQVGIERIEKRDETLWAMLIRGNGCLVGGGISHPRNCSVGLEIVVRGPAGEVDLHVSLDVSEPCG